MIGYVLMCWGGPYPLFCFAFVLNGFGLGIQVSKTTKHETKNTIKSRVGHD